MHFHPAEDILVSLSTLTVIATIAAAVVITHAWRNNPRAKEDIQGAGIAVAVLTFGFATFYALATYS